MPINISWSKRHKGLAAVGVLMALGICGYYIYAKDNVTALIYGVITIFPLMELVWCLRNPIVAINENTITITSRRGLAPLVFPKNILRKITNDGKLISFHLNSGLKLDLPSKYIDQKGYSRIITELAVAVDDAKISKDA